MPDSSPTSLAAVAEEFLNRGSHALVCDTCFILDVIRVPRRAKSVKDSLNAILQVKQQVESGQILLICPNPVQREWTRIVQNEISETKAFIRETLQSYSTLATTASSFGINPLPQQNYSGLADDLSNLSSWFIHNAYHISSDPTTSHLALERANNRIPPARRGKGAQDCEIFVQLLGFADLINQKRTDERVIFATSNTNDFCMGKGNLQLKPEIRSDLEKARVKLCTQWPWAAKELTTQSD